jgi:prepilin signal peptidase PulO-like enzyme (type II secretory pathway)
MEYILLAIKIISALVTGFLAGHAVVYMFNRIPAEWLCDYGEEPSDQLRDTSVQRIKGYPWKLILAAGFMCGEIKLVFYDWQFCAAAVVFSWTLIIIWIADKKYGIIPDQFVIVTAISALGFIPFHDDVMDLILGAVLGAGIMLISALLGKLAFKRDSLGFGDVKLFAAIGLVLGFEGTLTVLVLSSITSALAFSAKLIRKRIKREDMLPLGPYICGAGIFYVVIIWPLL